MSVRNVCKWCPASALVVLGLSVGFSTALFAQPGPADAEEGVQVLTRGPVHEAFAGTVTFDPEPGVVAPAAPPAAIEELPPDQRPEGTNVAWIPGYFAWDDEWNDFLWVSGIWRALPPGRQWFPGYWGRSDQGFQWTSGYWADAQLEEVEYLPEPPATVEAGPNIAASSADQMWLPGCWVWQQNRYAWRPGFWATAQPDWVWTPAHYVWAPRGYVFVDGYWDYSIGRRGVLFAPVRFHRNVYSRPGFRYSPVTMINPSVFASHLFLRPRYQHYYFGDYYAADYQTLGFHASFSYHSSRYGYDPIYAHQRWQHRQDPRWEHHRATEFQNRPDHEDRRPPHTWAAQRALTASDRTSRERRPVMAAPYSEVTRSQDSPLRFQQVELSERQELGKRGHEMHRFREQRQELETSVAAPGTTPGPTELEPARVPLPRSPIVARPVEKLAGEQAPPTNYSAPTPDSKVEPRPRVTRSPDGPQQHRVRRMPLDQPDTQPQPEAEQPTPQPEAEQLTPQPGAERPTPQPGVERPDRQPGAERPDPQPEAERPTPQPGAEPPTPQPEAERPDRQPTAERPTPQPRAERPTPKPEATERPTRQPRAERPTPTERDDTPAGPRQDSPRGRGRDRG